MSGANIGKLQENTAALCKIGCETLRVSAIRGTRYVYPEKLKRPPLPSGSWIPDVRHPDVMAAAAAEFRMWYIQVESGGSQMEFLPGWNELWFPSGWNEQDPILLVCWIGLWQRTSKLRLFMFLSFPLLCHGFQITLLNLRLLWWSKSYQNTKT